MKRFLLTVTCSLLFIACKEEEKPPLSKDKMVAVLTDLHMAEVYSTMVNDTALHITNKNSDSLAYYYSTIFRHYNVSVEEFKHSLDWYVANSNELDSVYNNIITELSTQEGLWNARNSGIQTEVTSQPAPVDAVPASEP